MAKLEPVGLDFLDRADHVVSTEVDIAASRDEVWTALVDNAGWADWFACSACSGVPATWSSPGDTRTIKIYPLTVDEIAVELDAPSHWAMTIVGTNLPTWTHGLEMVELFDTTRQGETRTELRWTGAFTFHWTAKPLAAMVLRRTAAAWGEGFEELSTYLAARR